MNERRRKLWNVQFGLRTLLIAAPLVAAALAFGASRFVRHNEVTVAGYMVVRDRVFIPQWQYPPKDANDDLMERTSDGVLVRALGSLSSSTLAWIETKDDPIAWLRSNVHITMIGTREVLQVSVFHYAPTESDVAAETEIINALMKEFDATTRGLVQTFFDSENVMISPARVQRQGWL
jgi:hypothetical protein